MRRWYAVSCQPQMELWARTNLWERGIEVYLPLRLKRRRHARRTDIVKRPLFPGYLFARAELAAGERRLIDGARGVRYLVRFGEHVPAVADDIIAEIRGREDADGLIRLNEALAMKPGDRVRVVDGALCDQVGLFDSMNDERRVIILLDLLGRQVRARVPAEHLARES